MNSIESKSDSIQLFYTNYVNQNFVVNRRYQRKLVWEASEKVKFIDSILKKFPVPLFLAANIGSGDGMVRFEIIDGIQRLNAIVAFLENEIGATVGGKTYYFDLSTLAHTNQRVADGTLVQKQPMLPKEQCLEFVQYQLPFSYITASGDDVDEVFRRINSFGRRLSEQEIRQAGATCSFSDIVRELSSEIRGDISSSNILSLNAMNSISLSNQRLNYGINISNVFWVKKGIIKSSNMRISRDEEIVAYLVLHILFGYGQRPSTKTLDQLYHRSSRHELAAVYDDAENKILSLNKASIKNKFNQTFSVIKQMLDVKSPKRFNDLLFPNVKSEKIGRVFQIVFIAVYELLFTEHLKLKSAQELQRLSKAMGQVHLNNIRENEWTHSFRKTKVDAIKGVIRSAFEMKDGEDAMYDDWTQEIDNLFQLSRIEGAQYDFKIGFHDLQSGETSPEVIQKFVKILTAQVNKAPNTYGYVVVGIGESEKSVASFKNFYNINNEIEKVQDTDFYITGLDAEIEKFYTDHDNFLRQVKKDIDKAPVDDEVKRYIKMNMKFPCYHGKSILILALKSDRQPFLYNDKYYVREGNDTKEISTTRECISYEKKFSKL